MSSARMPAALFAVVGALFGTAAPAANLILNPEFATNANNWSLWNGYTATVTFARDASDGSPALGSGLIVDTATGVPGNVTVGGQVKSSCMAITQANYDFSIRLKIGAGTTSTPIAQVNFYNAGTCALLNQITSDAITTWTPVGNGWQQGSLSNMPVSAIATFADIWVTAGSDSTTVHTNFDHVLFGPTGTAPVQVQSFGVE